MNFVVDSLRIFPRVFAEGTRSMTVERRVLATVDQTNTSESATGTGPQVNINVADASRSIGMEWDFLLQPGPPGPLICRRRGKLLSVAAGPVRYWLGYFFMLMA